MKEDWKKEAKPFMEGLLVGRKEREAEIIRIIDKIDIHNEGELWKNELKEQLKEQKEQ